MRNNNIIGIIGGMGPQASAEFYRLLIDGARRDFGARNNDDFPEILLDSLPVPDFLADTEKMEIAAGMLEDRVRRLTSYGISLITMACNTACILSDRLQKQTNVPFISVVDEVVRKVVGDNRKVLLLATPTSLRLGLYQLQLARYGVPYVVPEPSDFQELEFIVRGVLDGSDRMQLMQKLVKLTERYVRNEHIDGIVLGCTELPLVFPSNYRLPVYSSLSILAESILKQYYTKPAGASRSPSGIIHTRLTERSMAGLRNTKSDTIRKSVSKRGSMKRFLSGITPSGDGSLHIGNYLGAVRQFVELAKTNECFLMVADLHGLTTIQDKKQLTHNIETLILNELALLRGFLTEEEFSKIVFFRQSDVPMHTECQSILNNVTPLGLLKRAHAYKDKLAGDVMEDDINVGLFSYPMLMAADILLYQSDLVPVGKDQKQHIEITRDIADRFNKIFKKKVFTLPEPYIPEEVAVVLGIDGKRKMSKTLGNIISIFESEEVIKKQVMGTYTDPTRKHATDLGHIEGNMVFSYLDFFGEPQKVSELKDQYKKGAVGDVEVKEYLFESLMGTFMNARKQYDELKANPKNVREILENGQEKALAVASQTMREVRDAVGLTTQYSFFVRSHLARQGETFITMDEFSRIEVRVGKVIEAKNKEGSDKLIRLVVDFGPSAGSGLRTIFTGVRGFGYTPEDFAGKQFLFVVNLEPKRMMGEESQGMILAVDSSDPSTSSGHVAKPLFISAEGMPVGAKIR